MANFQMGGFSSIPTVVKNLLIVNVLVWVAQYTFKEPFDNALALHYIDNPNFGPWQFVSYMFMHSTQTPMHIVFNMIGLWMFGSALENIWGAKRFLLFYLICGIGAGLVQMLASRIDMLILDSQYSRGAISFAEGQLRYARIVLPSIVGASGAIMGIFAGFAYLFPNTPLMLMFIPIPIKAKYLMMGLIALDLFGGFRPGGNTGIAHFAHIGGALIGLILVIIMNRNNRRTFY
jgi:membrane associated rhomboid family serine protease